MMRTRTRLTVGVSAILCVGACYDGVDADLMSGDSATSDGSFDTEDPGDEGIAPQTVPQTSVPEPLVARLNHTQYANAIEDLFDTALTDEERGSIPRDLPVGSAYSTTVQGQFFGAQYVLGYANVARSVVERLGPATLLADFADCNIEQASCLDTFIEALGRRLHRRPLTDVQKSTYQKLAAATTAEAEPLDAVTAVTEAMLQSPYFLYRLENEVVGEPGEVYSVDGYELATRLSFFLWQSLPDVQLLDFAAETEESGSVRLSDLNAEIERLLANPRFARTRRQFWGDYTLASVAGFNAAEPDVRDQLRDSLVATLDRVSGVDAPAQSLEALFLGEEFVMTGAVAELAGAVPKEDGLAVYRADETDMRLGVLSHPGFLAALGTTSFVGRGLFMTERLLCQHILPPPGDQNTTEAIMDTEMQTESLTPRGASEFRFSLEPVCLTCHDQFEHIAYAFEQYDMVGRHTLLDDEGRELFSDGSLPAFRDRPEIAFADAQELFESLAQTENVYRCMVENMMEYATGFSASTAEEAVLAGLEVFSQNGRTFDALVRAVATNPQLTYKRSAEED